MASCSIVSSNRLSRFGAEAIEYDLTTEYPSAAVIGLHNETTTARTITFEVSDWWEHVAGQHVNVRWNSSALASSPRW
jgi:hypothetical protein